MKLSKRELEYFREHHFNFKTNYFCPLFDFEGGNKFRDVKVRVHILCYKSILILLKLTSSDAFCMDGCKLRNSKSALVPHFRTPIMMHWGRRRFVRGNRTRSRMLSTASSRREINILKYNLKIKTY